MTETISPKPQSFPDQENGIADFFAFRLMIVPTIIQMIYVVGMFVIFAVAIIWFTGTETILRTLADSNSHQSPASPVGRLFVDRHEITILNVTAVLIWLIFANLLWRAICEFWVVVFSIHRAMEELSRQSQVDRAAIPSSPA